MRMCVRLARCSSCPFANGQIANAVKHVEATHAWIETATYSFWKMDSEEKRVLAAGTMALLKAQGMRAHGATLRAVSPPTRTATQTMELCAREAAQILGGLSYSRGGQGAKVERLYREVGSWCARVRTVAPHAHTHHRFGPCLSRLDPRS